MFLVFVMNRVYYRIYIFKINIMLVYYECIFIMIFIRVLGWFG